jgi:hypothetical protein
MKKLHRLPVFILWMAMLFLGASCKKTFFTDANRNPNAPDSTSITPGVLLPTVQGALAYVQGGDLSRYATLITQQTKGVSRQAQGYYGYTFTSVDFDNVWGNLYTSVMENNKKLMELADAKRFNRYSGISRILMAYSLQLAVDTWGPVPYSQAFQGDKVLQPAYDNDKALYDTIISLLNVAMGQLNADAGFATPGADDFIYGGDANKWIKFAHAIKARLYIHQSKGDAAMAALALSEAEQSFTSNAENAVYVFGNTETSAGPWYQFNQQRGDIVFDETTLGMQLQATNDPRYLVYVAPDYDDVNQVGMGAYYGAGNAPVEFITYDELLFIKAEATLRSSGNIAAAQNFYREAITKNMEKLGIAPSAIATYLAANGTLPASVDAAIAKVAEEEYKALFLNPEVWTLWRRTNSPALAPVVGTNVPRRLLYPQTEYSNNKANTPSATLFSPRIFWDK